MNWLQRTIEWPARSPDLTPICYGVIFKTSFTKIGHKALISCKMESHEIYFRNSLLKFVQRVHYYQGVNRAHFEKF